MLLLWPRLCPWPAALRPCARLYAAAGRPAGLGLRPRRVLRAGQRGGSQAGPRARRGAAFSLFVGGITVANILGLPAGTAIGNAFGWRMSFLVIAAMALLAVVAIAFALPGVKGEREPEAPLAAAGRRNCATAGLDARTSTIAIVMVGSSALGTFQVPLLIEITRIDPASCRSSCCSVAPARSSASSSAARLADWRPAASR